MAIDGRERAGGGLMLQKRKSARLPVQKRLSTAIEGISVKYTPRTFKNSFNVVDSATNYAT